MTPKQINLLRSGGHPEYCGCPGCIGSITQTSSGGQNLVPPSAPREPQDSDYNGLSVVDAHYFGQMKHVDRMHRADMVASEHSRGKRLNQYLEEKGAAQFNSNYKLS